MKIGELNMHCGECRIIDQCDETFLNICICHEERFEKVEEDKFLQLIEASTKKSKKA